VRAALATADSGIGVCHGAGRSYYRASADRETYPTISERVVKPEYAIGRTQLEPAATSRLADPTNPDRPPKPPDDPSRVAPPTIRTSAAGVLSRFFGKSRACEMRRRTSIKYFKRCKPHDPQFDVRAALYHLVGIDLTAIESIDEIHALTLISELGTDFIKWPTMKHFTSWLGLCPNWKPLQTVRGETARRREYRDASSTPLAT